MSSYKGNVKVCSKLKSQTLKKGERGMKYSELVNLVEKDKYLEKQMDVVAYLIGYQKKLDTKDFENVIRLYEDGYIKA